MCYWQMVPLNLEIIFILLVQFSFCFCSFAKHFVFINYDKLISYVCIVFFFLSLKEKHFLNAFKGLELGQATVTNQDFNAGPPCGWLGTLGVITPRKLGWAAGGKCCAGLATWDVGFSISCLTSRPNAQAVKLVLTLSWMTFTHLHAEKECPWVFFENTYGFSFSHVILLSFSLWCDIWK